jgi:hypothetical protein
VTTQTPQIVLGFPAAKREKFASSAPPAPKFFEICHTPRSLAFQAHAAHVSMERCMAPGHEVDSVTVRDLKVCLATIFGPSPPQPARRAARRVPRAALAHRAPPSSPGPAAPGLGRFSAAPTKHDGQQASRITPHASMVGCRIEHVVPEEVAQVAVVIVVFPVVVLVRRARGCNVWSGKIVTLFYMYIMRRICNAGNRNTHLSSQPPTRSVS